MHIENLLFILLIAMAVLFRLLASKVGKARQKQQDQDRRTMTRPPPLPEPIERAPVESDAERIRRFLEALGQPTGSSPPPPVVPRTDIPPRPLAPVQPPAGPFAPPWKLAREGRRQRKAISRESPPPESVESAEKISPATTPAAPAFEVHEGPLPVESVSPITQTSAEAYAAPKARHGTSPSDWRTFGVAKKEESKADIATLLASTSGLRSAIILREIFGPPRSLQAFDLL